MVFGDATTGAQNDLERVTDMAHKMVCRFGMSEKLGPLTFGLNESQIFLGRDFYKDREYSEEIAFEIDKEIRQFVDECYHRAKTILEENRDVLDAMAGALLDHEVLTAEEVKDLSEQVKKVRKPKEETVEPETVPNPELAAEPEPASNVSYSAENAAS